MRILPQRCRVGHGNDRHRARDDVSDVGAVGICPGATALTVRDVQRVTVGRRSHRGRIPAGGDQSGDMHRTGPDPHDGHGVVAGHRDVQRAAVGRQRERVRVAADRRARVERDGQLLDHATGLQVDPRHAVRAGEGDEQAAIP